MRIHRTKKRRSKANFFVINLFLFIWLHEVLVAACGSSGPLHWEHRVLNSWTNTVQSLKGKFLKENVEKEMRRQGDKGEIPSMLLAREF